MNRKTMWPTALAVLLLVGCTQANPEVPAEAQAGDQVLSATDEAPDLIDSIPLFPSHTYLETFDAEQAEFFAQLVEVPAKAATVADISEQHAGPGEFYPMLSTALPGDEVTVDGRAGNWWRLADGQGFMRGTDLGMPLEFSVATSVGGCNGELTALAEISEYVGKQFYSIHSYCGGDVLLDTQVGQPILLSDESWRIASIAAYPMFSNASALVVAGRGEVFIMACDLVHQESIVFGLERG